MDSRLTNKKPYTLGEAKVFYIQKVVREGKLKFLLPRFYLLCLLQAEAKGYTAICHGERVHYYDTMLHPEDEEGRAARGRKRKRNGHDEVAGFCFAAEPPSMDSNPPPQSSRGQLGSSFLDAQVHHGYF